MAYNNTAVMSPEEAVKMLKEVARTVQEDDVFSGDCFAWIDHLEPEMLTRLPKTLSNIAKDELKRMNKKREVSKEPLVQDDIKITQYLLMLQKYFLLRGFFVSCRDP